MKKTVLIIAVIILYSLHTFAKVDTISINSGAMSKNIRCVVITPDNYSEKGNPYNVVYLLHGYSGNYSSWINQVPGIENLAQQYQQIIVCPDGGFSSWYWDSPIDESYQYETHIINEVIPFIDNNYNTVKNKKGRAISGLSMGGHGSLYLAFKHQDIFGACGAQSGGVDIRPFPDSWHMYKRLGTYHENEKYWEENSVINLVYLIKPESLSISIDCGIDDFFHEVNLALHKKLLYMNINHDYTERPGEHTWSYWRNSVQYQLLFFHNYFNN